MPPTAAAAQPQPEHEESIAFQSDAEQERRRLATVPASAGGDEGDELQPEVPEFAPLVVGEGTPQQREFPIRKRPNALLLAELGNIESGSPDAYGAIALMFKTAMGPDGYYDFRQYVLDNDLDVADLIHLVEQLVEKVVNRPTR